MSVFFSIVIAILLFSFLIFIHELGHFIAAKLSGVQVNEFAMFMGPALVKWRRGETEYSIRSIPIGGYCAMEGENEDTDNPRSFQKAKWWKRLIILVAGSFMNLVAGLLLMFIVFMPKDEIVLPVITEFTDYCTIDGEDGLQVGDRILELDGERLYVREDFELILYYNPGDVHDLVVKRDGRKVVLDDFHLQWHPVTDEDGNVRQKLGISFQLLESPTVAQRAAYAWNNTVDMIRNTRLSIQLLFTGQAGFRDLSGPVGIVHAMTQTAAASSSFKIALMNLLNFGGMIAIALAATNLLPIPALDGGRVVGLLLTTAIEAVTKKKINPKFESCVHGIGMVLLMGLMAVILFKDVFVIFKG